MKNGFIRMETRAAGSGARVMGKRTLAIMLCFVMLITAIGSGSVLSAVAVAFEGSGAGVLAQAAKEGAEAADITLSDDTPAAVDSSDTDEPFVDDIEDGFVVSKKADADLAELGQNTKANAHVFFDNSVYNWSNVYILYGGYKSGNGAGNYTQVQQMTKVSNTSNLYYVKIAHTEDNRQGFRFTDTSHYSGTWNLYDTNVANKTDVSDWNLNANTVYLATPGTNGSLTMTTGGAYGDVNYYNKYCSTVGGNSYSDGSTGGSFTIDAYYLQSDDYTKTVAADTATVSTDYNWQGMTLLSTTTLTATPASGYAFEGYYGANGSLLSS